MSIVHQNVFMTIIFFYITTKKANKQTNKELTGEREKWTLAEKISLIEPKKPKQH